MRVDMWFKDVIEPNDMHWGAASRVFKINSIVDWLEGCDNADLLLMPRRWIAWKYRKFVSLFQDGYSSDIEVFARLSKHFWVV